MAQPYIGEIRMGGWNFAPVGWLFCDGQSLPISENEALFQLIGTTYGGDGQETFNLPNLQSRTPMHMGNGPDGVTYPLAQAAGVETVTLTTQQIPVHTHQMVGSVDVATTNQPNNNVLGSITPAGTQRAFRSVPLDTMAISPTSVTPAGGSQPHDNLQPYTTISFIISLFGIFPQPT